ncbi:MAG TPA: Imm17 family immunity protein [Gemmatimonadales bacterium]
MAGWFLIGIGAFAIAGAVMRWPFFMEHRKAQFFIKIMGQTGTRVFYVVLGLGFLLVGGLAVAGVLDLASR